MPSKEESQNGILAIKKAIHTINNDSGSGIARAMLTISAKAKGLEIVSAETIECLLTINHSSAEICIFWENHGYKAYKELGLFGQMNSRWQYMKSANDSTLIISDDANSYEITVNY